MDLSWLKTFGKGHCTLWFSRVFDVPIDDLCYDHDAAYRAGVPALKIKSDFVLASSVWNRAERADTEIQAATIKAIAVAMGAAVGTVGWLFWAEGVAERAICDWIDNKIDPQIL